MSNRDAIETTWNAFRAAWAKFQDNPLDKAHARVTLRRALEWQDAFIAANQPRRVQTLLKNGMTHANSLDLSHRDFCAAWRETFANRPDMWEVVA